MNKTVLITGASRGIGAATAREFAKKGYLVAINYNRSKEQAEAVLEELRKQGYQAMIVKADVSNACEVQSMVDEVISQFGTIDVLVNNAGIAKQRLFIDISEEEWNRMLAVNVSGVFHCSQKVLPLMIKNQRGKIINVSSIWGITGASCEVHYSATKAAVIGLTKALAKEVGLSHIQVNCVAPGVTKTDMLASLDEETMHDLAEETPLGTIGEPSDIAHTILFLASDEADFITGQVISPNGGFVI